MGRSLLMRLLAVIRALLLKSKGVLNRPLARALRTLAYIWSFIRSPLRIVWKKKGRDGKPKELGQNASDDLCDDLGETYTVNDSKAARHEPELTTRNDNEREIIPLDSSISCSLHPYPYIHNNNSRSSLSLGLRAARSAHSLAVSSRNASRSSHQIHTGIHTGSSRMSHEGDGGEYTFTLKSPDQPNSPTSQFSRSPRRGYSMSSPDLGSGAVSQQIIALANTTSRTTTSPAESIRAFEGGEGLQVAESVYDEDDIKLYHERIFPMCPEFFPRYEKTKFVDREETNITIKPFTRDFKSKPDPPGWTPILHPEGVLYFYNATKKTVTEVDLYDPVYYNQITEDIGIIEDFLRDHRISLPANHTLAMELHPDEDDPNVITTEYYFADHDKRVIFFLDSWESSSFPGWSEMKGVNSLAHVRHEVEAQYWYHVMLYPSTIPRIHEATSEMKDLILHYIGDATTSAFSTSPYDLDELYKMLGLANSLKKISSPHTIGAASLISRIMLVFARQKFYNWYGLPERRIYRNLSVHGVKPKRTWLVKILSPLLFSAPDIHLSNLEKMWVDGIMHGAVWSQSIKKLNEEWQEFILYATVLLNANVAFLAIQSIDIDEDSYRSPVQVASYLSTVASIGSVIIGLLLVRQNRTRAHGTANDVCQFLKQRSHPTLGLETLAILYSLPYALLLWGMVSFLAAFAWNCFDNSNVATRTVMGAAWVAFAALVVWCIWMGWVKHQSEADNVPDGGEEATTNPADDKVGSGVKMDRHPTLHDILYPEGLGSRGSLGTQPAGAGSITGGLGQAGQKKKRWNWPPFSFWNLRRTSYDSEKTVTV